MEDAKLERDLRAGVPAGRCDWRERGVRCNGRSEYHYVGVESRCIRHDLQAFCLDHGPQARQRIGDAKGGV